MKQDEVLQEVNPQRVIEHIENKNVIPFNGNKHQQLMAELNALPAHQEKEVVYFKQASVPTANGVEHTTENLTPAQRWIDLDKQVKGGEQLTDKDQDFWEMFQLSKKFKQLEEDDAELNTYLAQRQG